MSDVTWYFHLKILWWKGNNPKVMCITMSNANSLAAKNNRIPFNFTWALVKCFTMATIVLSGRPTVHIVHFEYPLKWLQHCLVVACHMKVLQFWYTFCLHHAMQCACLAVTCPFGRMTRIFYELLLQHSGWTHTEITVSTGSWPWMRKFPARIWSCNLLITSPVLYHWAIPTPRDKATALCWQTGWCLAMSVLSPFKQFTNSNTHPTGQWKKQFPLVSERNSSTHHWTKPRTQLGSTNNYSKLHSSVENNTNSIGQ